MSELKTKKTQNSPKAFIEQVENETRRKDAYFLLDLMSEITGETGSMWGSSIVGFGQYHYKYKSGRESDWFVTGFSPRKSSLSLYIMTGFDHYQELLSRLGKYKTGKGCLYINKLSDVDLEVLEEIISSSVSYLKSRQNQ